MTDEPVVQCDLCNAELTVNSDDLVNIIQAWEKGAGEGATPKQITDICLWVYGTAIERSLFLLLKRGEIEIMGMEDGQPQLRAVKNGTKPVAETKPAAPKTFKAEKPDPKKIPPSAEGKTTEDPSRSINPPKPRQYSTTRKNWVLGKQLWYQDKSLEEIAEALKCSARTVGKHARMHWSRRKRSKNKSAWKPPTSPKPPKSKPAVKKSAPAVQKPVKKVLIRRDKRDYIRCTSCYLDTTTFPCEHCGCEHKELQAKMIVQ